jgi:predicted nucleic acid-binding protein
MRTALDTNILIALWERRLLAAGVASGLSAAQCDGSLVISPAVYAEFLAHPILTEPDINEFLSQTGIQIDMQLHDATWVEAGRRFAQYARARRRSSGDGPRRLLADFIIGAHALIQADRLMTLDDSHFRRYFPELVLYPVSI